MATLGDTTIDRRHLLGVFLVLAAATCFSTTGLFVRLIDSAGGWQMLFYRSLVASFAVFSIVALRHRGRVFRAYVGIGWAGVGGAACLGLGGLCFIWAFLHTTVANAIFVLGGLPFVTAILAWLALGERVRRATWFFMTGGFVGITIMVVAGLAAGRVLGNLLAVTAAISFATMTVILRARRSVDMVPVVGLSSLLIALISAPLAADFAISAHDLAICVLMGTVPSAIGYSLFTVGARYVRAGELTLLSNIEIILGPLWVWFAVSEIPRLVTLIGGGIVILAIAGQAVATARLREAP